MVSTLVADDVAEQRCWWLQICQGTGLVRVGVGEVLGMGRDGAVRPLRWPRKAEVQAARKR